jgi:hypothetical protein
MSRSRGRRRPTNPYPNQQQSRQQQVTVDPIRRGETIDLGDLSGDNRDPLTADFVYFGDRFRINPDLSELDIIDFLEAAEHVDQNNPRSMIMMKDFARRVIHGSDFEAFWAMVRKHRQGAQQMMDLMWKLIAGVSGNPTGQPPASSAGRPETTLSSPPDSYQPAGQSVEIGNVTPGDEQEMLRQRFLAQIERFEAMGENGVAMATQIAVAAEARGIDVTRADATLSGTVSG